ncbi:MAG TPA: hypothetical protein PK411_09405 [Mesotoga infera]|nr:hypothetical protein [Mesotoga infera]
MKTGRFHLTLLIVILTIIPLFTGCPNLEGLLTLEIPDKTVNEGEILQFDLRKYATDRDKTSLVFSIVLGLGELDGSLYKYEPGFTDSGEKIVRIRVTNSEGKTAEDLFKITVINVNRPPVVFKVSGPSGTISQSSSSFVWMGEYLDEEISRYEFRKDGGIWINIGLSESYVWDNYSEGSHTFEVRARDTENTYSNTLLWDFIFEASNLPPVITKVGGEEGNLYEQSNAFSWSGSDADGTIISYEYRKDGGKWVELALERALTWSDYLEGNHTFEVRAKDNEMAFSNILLWCFTYVRIPSKIWQQCFGGTEGDTGYAAIQTMRGDYLVVGKTYSNNGDVSHNNGGSDAWIIRVDNSGKLIWGKSLGGSNNEQFVSVRHTIEGGFILGGDSRSNDGDVSVNKGDSDVWIVKIDVEGNLVWQRSFGGSKGDSNAYVEQTTDGGYVFVAHSESNDGDVSGNKGSFDFWVVKLDSDGALVWQKSFGGTEAEFPYDIRQTNDGGYLVVGETMSNDGDVSGNHGSCDVWIIKLDLLGNLEWQKCLGGSNCDRVYAMTEQTPEGDFVIAGSTSSNDGDITGNNGKGDAWIVKLDYFGNIIWQKCVGGSGFETALSINPTADCGYIIGGGTTSTGKGEDNDCWIAKLDSNGELVWQKCLGGSSMDVCWSFKETDDGSYIIAGYTFSNDGDVSGNHGNADLWLVKLE